MIDPARIAELNAPRAAALRADLGSLGRAGSTGAVTPSAADLVSASRSSRWRRSFVGSGDRGHQVRAVPARR